MIKNKAISAHEMSTPMIQVVKIHGIRNYMNGIEAELIGEALELCDFNNSRAAELLGMKRTLFVYKRKKYGFPVSRPNKRFVRNLIHPDLITG